MCPPDYYGVEYEINPWMTRARQPDKPSAQQQWNGLFTTLESLGAKIELLQAVPGLPDLVFTANAALIYQDVAVLSRFRPEQRRGEEPVNLDRLKALGFKLTLLPKDMFFEGAGDALFCGETLFAGYRIRSDALAHQLVGKAISARVIPVELVDAYFYHLDTCFCPVSAGLALWYPPAFDEYGQRVVREYVEELIAVPEEEAKRFACNAVVVNKTVVLNTGCPESRRMLQARGFQTRETPLDEFIKAGGSAKCLTLRLDGEEAAQWRTTSPS